MDSHLQQLKREASNGDVIAMRRYIAALERAVVGEDAYRRIYINSNWHYQLRVEPNNTVSLVQYGTGDPDDEDNDLYDSCPGMQHRGPFEPHEGRVIETFIEGEAVEIIMGWYDTQISVANIEEGRIYCGDDLNYGPLKPVWGDDE